VILRTSLVNAKTHTSTSNCGGVLFLDGKYLNIFFDRFQHVCFSTTVDPQTFAYGEIFMEVLKDLFSTICLTNLVGLLLVSPLFWARRGWYNVKWMKVQTITLALLLLAAGIHGVYQLVATDTIFSADRQKVTMICIGMIWVAGWAILYALVPGKPSKEYSRI
jgi:hypothetical protein